MPSTVERFNEVVYDQDYEEGQLIDELYDQQLENPRFVTEVLRRAIKHKDADTEAHFRSLIRFSTKGAITQADQQLTPTVPGGETFGYEVAKKARRWWMYSTAYLRDIELSYDDREPADPVQAAKLANYQTRKNDSGVSLINRDPSVVLPYFLLEMERMKSERLGEPPADPFAHERRSMPVLTTAISEETENPDPTVYFNLFRLEVA